MIRGLHALSDLDYKNSELVPKITEKLEWLLLNQDHDESTHVNPEHVTFGGKRGFNAWHYVYKGFEQNEEFEGYLSTLVDWETSSMKNS